MYKCVMQWCRRSCDDGCKCEVDVCGVQKPNKILHRNNIGQINSKEPPRNEKLYRKLAVSQSILTTSHLRRLNQMTRPVIS